MRRTYLTGLFLATCPTAAVLPRAHSQEKAAATDTAAVLRVYRARARQMDPIQVKYRLTREETQAWVDLDDGAKSWGAKGSRIVRFEAEYARKGSMIRSTSHSLDPPAPGSSEWSRNQFWIFDGQNSVQKSNRPNEFLLSKSNEPRWMAVPPTHLTREESLLSELEDWAAGRGKVLASTAERVEGGRRMVVVNLRFPETKWSHTAWLFPDRDLAIYRYEVNNASGGPVDRIEVTEIGNVNGLSFPMRATHRHYLNDRRLGVTTIIEVTSVESDANKVPTDLFRFAIPPGAHIYDVDTKTTVRQTEVSQSHLDEAVRHLTPAPNLWRRWWVIGSVAAGLVILPLLVFAARRSRRGRQGTETRTGGGGRHETGS